MRYSIKPRERRYIKGYGFMSFARNFGNKYGEKLINTAIKTSTNFSNKYSKRLKDTATKAGKDFAIITGKKIIHKTAEATGDLIGNKIADKITARPIKENDVTNERYISPEERQKIIDKLRLA